MISCSEVRKKAFVPEKQKFNRPSGNTESVHMQFLAVLIGFEIPLWIASAGQTLVGIILGP